MLWNLSEPSHNYYWLLYGIDLLQYKNTSCYSMSWEGLLNILKLKFNPSFHKKEKDPNARNITAVSSAPESFTIPNRTITTLLLKGLFLKFHYSSCTLLLYITLYQVLLASITWKQWTVWRSRSFQCSISTVPG